MDSNSILKEALHLRPAERLQLIEMLTRSLNKLDENIEKRYKALEEGRFKTIAFNEIIERYK